MGEERGGIRNQTQTHMKVAARHKCLRTRDCRGCEQSTDRQPAPDAAHFPLKHPQVRRSALTPCWWSLCKVTVT